VELLLGILLLLWLAILLLLLWLAILLLMWLTILLLLLWLAILLLLLWLAILLLLSILLWLLDILGRRLRLDNGCRCGRLTTIICRLGMQLELIMRLGLHAPLRDHVDNLSKTANDIGYRPEAVIENGKNITYARQNLNKVVEADNPVVARIGRNVPLGLNVNARCRYGTTLKEPSFQAQTKARAAAGAVTTGAGHTRTDQILTAAILAHIALQGFAAQMHGAAAWEDHCYAKRSGILAWDTTHACFPLARIEVAIRIL